MPERKECPLCGEFMRLKETQSAVVVPGTAKPVTRIAREWVCPECDYFEEAEEEPA